ncbi:MAG: hypothetical protein Q8L55_11400 [Phycisphaerales bacterium]|nr:hypothetical protein [Phycisphaerales bacterium]
MQKLKVAALLFALVAVIALAAVNSHEVSVRFVVATVTLPVAFLVLLVFVLGLVAGVAAALLLSAGKRQLPPKP